LIDRGAYRLKKDKVIRRTTIEENQQNTRYEPSIHIHRAVSARYRAYI